MKRPENEFNSIRHKDFSSQAAMHYPKISKIIQIQKLLVQKQKQLQIKVSNKHIHLNFSNKISKETTLLRTSNRKSKTKMILNSSMICQIKAYIAHQAMMKKLSLLFRISQDLN